jgi:hypothetical protein
LKRTGVDETSYQQRWSASFDVIADILIAGLLHISFHQRWSASPEFLIDLIEGGATTYVFGVAIGYGF